MAEADNGDLNVDCVITDEDLDRARALIGADVIVRDRQYITEATEDSIRNFAQSTGDDNPLYADPDYGATTRWAGQIAPNIMAAVSEPAVARRSVEPRAQG